MASSASLKIRPASAPPDRRPTRRSARPERRLRVLPDVDERLVMPEMRYEAVGGRVAYVAPSDEAHGSRHSKVSALLEVCAGEDYDVASDMLTRTSRTGDMAPDASVFPRARDPRTGGRQIEELAFEVVSKESLEHAGKKARALVERGVRRVVAIDVGRRRALVWSRETNAWEMLPRDGVIEDQALAVPLPIPALVDAVKADDALAQALIAKKNPVIDTALRGARLQGKIEALLAVLGARGFRLSKKAEKQIRAEEDEATIEAWLRRSVSCASIEELLGK
jgi:hypothetical protein